MGGARRITAKPLEAHLHVDNVVDALVELCLSNGAWYEEGFLVPACHEKGFLATPRHEEALLVPNPVRLA